MNNIMYFMISDASVLKTVLWQLFSQVHRLVVTSPTNEIEGVISLSDILSFLLQDDLYMESASNASCAAMVTVEKLPESCVGKTIQASG